MGGLGIWCGWIGMGMRMRVDGDLNVDGGFGAAAFSVLQVSLFARSPKGLYLCPFLESFFMCACTNVILLFIRCWRVSSFMCFSKPFFLLLTLCNFLFVCVCLFYPFYIIHLYVLFLLFLFLFFFLMFAFACAVAAFNCSFLL